MIAGWWMAAAPLAFGVTRTVTSTADTDTGTGAPTYTGTLRYHLNRAAPGDRIVFGANFSASPPTPITIASSLPTMNDAGVVLDGDGRVAIGCAAAMTTGNGLTVTANDVHVRGLEVRDCPGDGIRVSGHDVQVVGNHALYNDQSGIHVTGLSTTTSATTIELNEADHNCVSPGTVSCAGIIVKKGTGTGVGPSDVWIGQNHAHEQLSGGHGIAVQAGSGSLMYWNTADDNAGAGVSIAATTSGVSVDSVMVGNNVIGGNLGPGILLGTRSSFVFVGGNDVDGNGLGTVPAAGISVYASDDHTIEGNLITRSGAEGILVSGLVGSRASPAERVTLRDNLVGTDDTGAAGLANGTTGLLISGSGASAVNHLVEGNTFAGGTSGVVIDAGSVTLTEYVVGLGPDRATALGPQGAGITVQANGVGTRIDGRIGGVDRPNYVASTGGPGIVVLADDTVVSDNVVGWGRGGEARGTGDEGIWLKAGADVILRRNRVGNSGDEGILVWASGATPVTRPTLNANVLEANGDAGIRVEAVSGGATWTENRATNNGTCALQVAAGVNGTARDAVPVLRWRSGAYLEGTYTVPVGLALDRVEVFADDGSEAGRYLGTASAAGGSWSLSLADDELPLGADDRVAAVAVFANGASSRLEEWCNDGCPEPGAASCADGNDCTTDTCGASACAHAPTTGGVCTGAEGGCVVSFGAGTCQAGSCAVSAAVFAPAGTACVDQDACTKNTTCDASHACTSGDKVECDDGNPCTNDGVYDEDEGAWVGSTCDPQTGCPAVALRTAGYPCDDDDLCTGLGTCNAVGGCEDVDPTLPSNPMQTNCNVCTCDPDTGWSCEGIPNDGKCGPDDFWIEALGGPDPACLDAQGRFDDDGFPNVWETAADDIDVNCDGNYPDDLVPGPDENSDFFDPGVPNVLYEVDWMAGDAVHEHVPGDLGQAEVMFARELIVALVHVDDEIPHADSVFFQARGTPLAGVAPWVRFADLKAAHFDSARRRGVYHYGLVVHSQADGGGGGYGELPGDDAVMCSSRDLTDPYDLGEDLGMGLVVHEGGHNLGLQHQGKVDPDLLDPNDPEEAALIAWMEDHPPGQQFEVNHLSSMNYWYGGKRGGLIDVDGEMVYDYARSYELQAGGRAVLNDLDATTGYSEANPLWSDPKPIPDEELYRVRWRCPPGVGNLEKRRFAHLPGRTTLGAADRRMDLDCDGYRETTVATQPLTSDDTITLHTTFDEWAALRFDFQRRGSMSTYGPLHQSPRGPGEVGESASWPRAELYGGCVNPQVPRPGIPPQTSWRTPVVLFGSPEFSADRVSANVKLSGAVDVERFVQDLDGDGFDDLWLEFRPSDLLLAGLHTNAQELDLFARPTDLAGEQDLERMVGAAFDVTRVTNPPDSDGDGIQDACDACPTVGSLLPGDHRLPDGCPP